MIPWFLVWMKKNQWGHILNLTSSGEACRVASRTQRPKVATEDGLRLPLANYRWVRVGSCVPGCHLP